MKYTRLGKILLIISAVIGIVPFFVYLSLPLYITGFILIIKADIAKRAKVTWLLMPLLIIAFVWFLLYIVSSLYVV